MAANLYITLMLGIKVKDCNSGFRCFKRKVLEKINLEKLESKGPSIVQEILFKAHLNRFRIKEIPFYSDLVYLKKLGKIKLGFKKKRT